MQNLGLIYFGYQLIKIQLSILVWVVKKFRYAFLALIVFDVLTSNSLSKQLYYQHAKPPQRQVLPVQESRETIKSLTVHEEDYVNIL
jgi:hypothetical protein